jgi:r1t holin
MFTVAFLKAVLERAVRTFAQALVAVMTADGFGLLDADWVARLSAAGMATLLSVLTSIVAYGVGNPGPSLSTEHVEPEPPKP